MANAVCNVLLTNDELIAPAPPMDVSAGGMVEFWGRVRLDENGREIEGLEYEANWAMAKHQLTMIAQEALAKFGLRGIVLHHRVGFVKTGEPSLYLRATSSHRAEAFAASQWMVDELKKRVPIWKKPRFAAVKSEHGTAAEFVPQRV